MERKRELVDLSTYRPDWSIGATYIDAVLVEETRILTDDEARIMEEYLRKRASGKLTESEFKAAIAPFKPSPSG